MKSNKFIIKDVKDINKMLNSIYDGFIRQEKNKFVRKFEIKAAKIVQQFMAEEAPNPAFADIISKLPIEKRQDWGSGVNASLSSKGRVTFVLSLSPNTFKRGPNNPYWGIMNSIYGRKGFSVDPKHPIPVVVGESTDMYGRPLKQWNHPTLGEYVAYDGSSRYVAFRASVGPVYPQWWVSKAMMRATDAMKAKEFKKYM